MICIVVLFVALAYILLCMFYRRRIRLLTETGKGGWKLWKLKKQVTDLEDRKAAEIVKGIQRSAESYSIEGRDPYKKERAWKKRKQTKF